MFTLEKETETIAKIELSTAEGYGHIILTQEICSDLKWHIGKVFCNNIPVMQNDPPFRLPVPSKSTILFITIGPLDAFGWKVDDELSVEINGHDVTFIKI